MANGQGNSPENEKETRLVKLEAGNQVTAGQLIELERRYEEFINLKDEAGFFRGLANYVKYIAETPSLDLAALSIKKIEEEDEKKVAVLEKKLRREIKVSETAIYKIIEANKLDWPYLKEVIDEYEGVKNGRIQSTATNEEALYGGLARIVGTIFEAKYKDLVKDYVQEYQDTGSIEAYKIAASYADYLAELNRFRERRKTSVWGSWDKLVLVYLVIHKYDDEISRLDPIKDVWRRMNFMGLRGEMMKVLEEKGGDRIEFRVEEYRISAKEVNDYLVKYSHGEEFLATIQRFGENISKIVIPSIEFPNRFVKEMQEVADRVRGFSEGYRKIATTIVEPMQILNKRMGEIADVYSNARIPVMDTPSVTRDMVPLKTTGSYTNELLTRLIEVNVEILEELRAQRGMSPQKSKVVEFKVEAVEVNLPMNKKAVRSELSRMKKLYDLGVYEFSLLEILMEDMGIHFTKDLKGKVGAKSLKHVKMALEKKIRGDSYKIESEPKGGYGRSYYRLIRLTNDSIPVR